MNIRKTKIIATIGPATNSLNTIKDLILSGANVLRLNLSHGNRESHENSLNIIKNLREKLNIPVSILLDTRGPEIRIGDFKTGSVELTKNNIFTFFANSNILGDVNGVSVNEPSVFSDVKIGSKILACDGLITFKVISKTNSKIECKVINGGILSNKKSLFLPGVELHLNYLNKSDTDDIIWGLKNGVDYIAASFVNSSIDVELIKKLINEYNPQCKIISKIESRFGVKNIDSIIESSDGIMVARGDLGVELPLESVPKIQKQIIEKCNEKGKIVITATEMLESMISSPRPTRAETSDVANAVYDGTSAIMLSAETAVGKYFASAVSTMDKIALLTEKNIEYSKIYFDKSFKSENLTDIMSNAAVHISYMIKNLDAIAVYTDSGHTARMISRFTPDKPIFAFTPNIQTYNQLALCWGIVPIQCKLCNSADEMLDEFNNYFIKSKIAKVGDMILIGTGSRIPTNTDMIKIHIIN